MMSLPADIQYLAHNFSPAAPRFSRHGAQRSLQRAIAPNAIEYTLTYGRLIQRTGVTFCVLGWRDIPLSDRRKEWAGRLVGTVVLLDENWRVITVYRNRCALRDIQRKLKRRVTTEELAAIANLAVCHCDDDASRDEMNA